MDRVEGVSETGLMVYFCAGCVHSKSQWGQEIPGVMLSKPGADGLRATGYNWFLEVLRAKWVFFFSCLLTLFPN